ncbi:MAG TPA: DUF2231 domain-containing protein [Thermomicrobiales bacterium]|nr:DUF2231 domain-containing protein [Thermomicrobiales bacterium]
MESKAKLFGHPIHPMLIPFPLGLLGTALVFDVIAALTDNAGLARAVLYALAGRFRCRTCHQLAYPSTRSTT